MDDDGDITPPHYAFLVSETEFDEILERIRERHLLFWAAPRKQRDQINECKRLVTIRVFNYQQENRHAK